MLSHLTAGLHVLGGGDHAEALVGIDGRENHTLTLDAHHGARGEVSHKQDALAYQLLRILIELGDARENGARSACTIVDGELSSFSKSSNEQVSLIGAA